MMSTARISLLYSGGLPISGLPAEYMNIGRGYVGIVPISVIIMIAVIAIAWIVLAKTKFGRRVYAAGGNENARGSQELK